MTLQGREVDASDMRQARSREWLRRNARRQRDFALAAASKRIRWMDALSSMLLLLQGTPLEGDQARRRVLALCRLRDGLARDLFPDLPVGRHEERRARGDMGISAALAQLAHDEDLDEANVGEWLPLLHDWLSFAVECLPRGLSTDGDPSLMVADLRLACLPDAMRFRSLCDRHAPEWPDGEAPPDQWLLTTSTEMALQALGVRGIEEAANAAAELGVLLRAFGQAILDAAFEIAFESAGGGVGPSAPPQPAEGSPHPGLDPFPRLRQAVERSPDGFSERSDPSRALVLERVEDCVLDGLPEGLALPAGWEPLRGLSCALHRRLDRRLADAWSLSAVEGARLAAEEGRRLPALQPLLDALREACGDAASCAIDPDRVRQRAWVRAQRVEGLVRQAMSLGEGLP